MYIMELKESSLLLVDSSNRIKNNVNILSNERYELGYRSIKLFENSSIAEIRIPNHNLSIDDIITINGVFYEECTDIVDVDFYPPYMSIDISSYTNVFSQHQSVTVRINKLNTYIFNNIIVESINKLYDSFHIINDSILAIPLYNTSVSNKDTDTLNITFIFDDNEITGNFVCSVKFPSLRLSIPESFDVVKKSSKISFQILSPEETTNYGINLSKINNNYDTLIINSSQLLIPLDNVVINNTNTYHEKIKITILELQNVNVNRINADFPTNNQRVNGSQRVISIQDDNIYIDIGVTSTSSYTFQTINSSIVKINYQKLSQEHNDYDFFLYKPLYNVTSIQTDSIQLPKYMNILKNNNQLKWKDIDENHYTIHLKEYFFENVQSFMNEISEQFNKVFVKNSTSLFHIDFVVRNNVFVQSCFYQKTTLYKPLKKINYQFEYNELIREKITLYFQNHKLLDGDVIRIEQAVSFRQ